MSEKVKDTRCRNWTTIVYPESAAENWQSILSDVMHVPTLISPLHDKDISANGEPKKPHYHVVFVFDGNKSEEQIRVITGAIGAVGLERVKSLRATCRYLCHMDDPIKAQYSPDDVVALCGLDYLGLCQCPSDKYQCISDMIDYCDENHITSFAKLFRYAKANRQDWFRVLCDSGTYVVKEYLKTAGYDERSEYSER